MQKSIIELFSSPTCPYCPRCITMLKELEQERNDIDAIYYSTLSEKGKTKLEEYNILTVPTFIITGPAITNKIGLKNPSKEKLNEAIDISLGLKQIKRQKSFLNSIKDIFKK